MKKQFLSLALIAAMAGLYSCSSESLAPEPDKTATKPSENNGSADYGKVLMTFHAGYAGQESAPISKTAIGASDTENKTIGLLFSIGDKINVNGGEFTSDLTQETATECNFTGLAFETGTYHAVYPSTATFADNQTSITATIPNTQTAVAGSFDKNAHVMVATEENGAFQFQTVNAFLKFTAPCKLSYVRIAGAHGECVAGSITIKPKDGKYYNPTVSSGSATSITLSGTIDEGEIYYIAYAPGEYKSGLIITLVSTDNKAASRTTKPVSYAPNKVSTIGGLDKLSFVDVVSPDALSGYLAACSDDEVTVYMSEYDESVKTTLQESSKKVNLILEGVAEIPAQAFLNCDALTSVSLPNATSIGDNAFMFCTSLTSVSLPNATSIGNDAFNGCSRLTSVSLPNATSIGASAFSGCNFLTSVSLPNATSIGEGAFSGCNFTSVSLPNATSIGDGAFSGCPLTSLSLPNATSIGDNAFQDCNFLTSVSLPNATSIGGYAFSGCNSLSKVAILGNGLSLVSYVFADPRQPVVPGQPVVLTFDLYVADDARCDGISVKNYNNSFSDYVKDGFKDLLVNSKVASQVDDYMSKNASNHVNLIIADDMETFDFKNCNIELVDMISVTETFMDSYKSANGENDPYYKKMVKRKPLLTENASE